MLVPTRPRITTIINVPNSPCPQPIGGGFLSSVWTLFSCYRYGSYSNRNLVSFPRKARDTQEEGMDLLASLHWKQQYLVSIIERRRAKCLHHRFVRLFFKAFLPAITHSGVAFACHAQVLSFQNERIAWFRHTGLGAVRVHRETLCASTGVELVCLPWCSIVVPDLDDVYTTSYHVAF